jgi:hypothetical protein
MKNINNPYFSSSEFHGFKKLFVSFHQFHLIKLISSYQIKLKTENVGTYDSIKNIKTSTASYLDLAIKKLCKF